MDNFRKYKYVDTISKSVKFKRLIWDFVYILFFRPTPRWAFHGWRRFLLRSFGASVGKGSKIAPTVTVWAPWNLVIGEFTAIADGVECYSMNKIIIGSKVAVSQRSFLCTGSHDVNDLKRPLVTRPIVIEDHAWIAAETFIHPGVVVHEGCVVGARAVVTKTMPAWTICAGNPCVPIRPRVVERNKD